MSHQNHLVICTALLDVSPQLVEILLEVKLLWIVAVWKWLPVILGEEPILFLLLKSLHASTKTGNNEVLSESENSSIDISIDI